METARNRRPNASAAETADKGVREHADHTLSIAFAFARRHRTLGELTEAIQTHFLKALKVGEVLQKKVY